jgi:alpha-D-ribose 1-methylphosphonate 5-triphosphate synthase subunit PhnH
MTRVETLGGSGFADPVAASQTTFRALLEAMSQPGRIVAAPPLKPPPGLSASAAAVLLTLADFETPVWLSDDCREAASWLGFQTGARTVDTPDAAAFAVVGPGGQIPALAALPMGTDEYPEHGATLIIEVARLDETGPLVLTGPGVDGARRFGAAGPPADIWREREVMRGLFPRGIDLVFTCGGRLACLPRTTRVQGA